MSGLFKKTKGVTDNIAEFSREEKERSKLKKKAQNSSVKPRGYGAKKTGVIAFWVMFGFMFVVVISTLFSKGSAETKDVTIEKNMATSQEAVQYAIDFTKTYFTWSKTKESKEDRKNALSDYYIDTIGQSADIAISTDSIWTAQFVDAKVKEIKEVSNNVALITLSTTVKHTKKGKKHTDSSKTKIVEKYFVVPVAYNGQTFGVYDLPRYTFVPEKTTVHSVTYDGLKNASNETTTRTREFLQTFFKVYVEDSKDKLNYLLANENVTNGLNGTMQLGTVKDATVYQSNREDVKDIYAFVTIELIDPETGLTYETKHQLTIIEKADQLVVAGVDNLGNITIN